MSVPFAEYVKQVALSFPTSKNVFVAHGDERTLYFNTKDKLYIDVTQISDPVELLIANSCNENIRRTDDKIVHDRTWTAIVTYQAIMAAVKLAYEKNCGLKNPRQSRMYKWLDFQYSEYNHESHEGFVALYRYMSVPTQISRQWSGNLPKPTADNVMAVLERMRIKYEDK